jgi:hypothetical protein
MLGLPHRRELLALEWILRVATAVAVNVAGPHGPVVGLPGVAGVRLDVFDHHVSVSDAREGPREEDARRRRRLATTAVFALVTCKIGLDLDEHLKAKRASTFTESCPQSPRRSSQHHRQTSR